MVGRLMGPVGSGRVISPWSKSPTMRPRGKVVGFPEMFAIITKGLAVLIMEGLDLMSLGKEGCSEGWNT